MENVTGAMRSPFWMFLPQLWPPFGLTLRWGITADGKRLRARLIRLIQGHLKSEPAREACNLRKFCAGLTAAQKGGRATSALSSTKRLLHLNFAVAALAPSVSFRLRAAVSGSGGGGREEREEQMSIAAELLYALLKLLKPVADEQPVRAEDGTPDEMRDALEVSHPSDPSSPCAVIS